MKPKIVALDAVTLRAEIARPSIAHEWIAHDFTPPHKIAERIRDATVVVTNKVPLRADDLSHADQLKFIAIGATGYDIVDIAFCRAHGIRVSNVRGYANRGVAEHALALAFSLLRDINGYHRRAVSGEWSASGEFSLRGRPIDGILNKQIGIIGAGNLGRATAALFESVGARAKFLARDSAKEGGGLIRLPLDELLATSDIISLHCPLTADNRNMINTREFQLMKQSAVLINTARGALVNSEALISALQSEEISGAGIDVLDEEPPPFGHPLLACNHPRLIVTPHIAWAGKDSLAVFAAQLADNINQFFAGTPRNLVA